MKANKIFLSNEGTTLTCYTHDISKEMPNVDVRPAVLVFPGGGYYACSDREADPVAMAFFAEGYNAFILRYSVGLHNHISKAIFDANEAIAYLHGHAEELHIDTDRIAIMGFSAGGHLAAWLCVSGKVKPAAAILGYPCILPEIGAKLSRELPEICGLVDQTTPPTFIFSTRNDDVVPIMHSIQYAAALDRAGVGFEMHIFRDGIHGLSLAKPFTSSGNDSMVNPDAAKWFALSVAWLTRVM